MHYWKACASIAALAIASGTMPTAAQASGAQSTDVDGIGDIVVTARKRAENAQNIPIAITAVSGEALQARSVQTFADVQSQTPSLTITGTNSDRNAMAISLRGLTQQDVVLTVDPAVGLYVDGVNVSKSNSTELSSLVDVERVEVLKGPQGTLYGRNTIGGAININYNLPTDRFEGQVTARTDIYGRVGGALVVNVPLGDDLAFRAVGQYDHRDAFGMNRARGIGVGGDLNGGNVRGALRYTGVDGLDLILRGDWAKSSTSGIPWRASALVPGSTAERTIIAQGGSRTAYLVGALANLGDYDSNLDFDSISRIKLWGTSLTGTVDVTDNIQFKSISAYRRVNRFLRQDLDGSTFNILNPQGRTAQKVFTQEVQLGGKAIDSRLDWLMGGFYSHETGFDETRTTSLGGVNPALTHGNVVNRSVAGFAQATFDATDRLSFTGGIRYTKDTKSLESFNRIITPTDVLVRCNLPVALNPGTQCRVSLKQSWDAWNYLASVDYKPMQDVLVYLKTSKGYKSGGFNLRGGADPLTFQPFRPETVTDYEIGVKSDWFDRKVRLNMAAYLANYNDIQRTVIVPGTLTPTLTVVRNAAKGRIRGLEAELTVVPVENLTLRGTFTHTDPKYKRYVDGLGRDLSGQDFLYVAKWAYSLSASYAVPLENGPLRLQADWNWQSRMNLSPDGTVRDAIMVKPYGLLNARVSKSFEREGVDVAFYVKNALNKYYRSAIIDTTASLGMASEAPSNPRIVGAEITKKF